MLNAVVIDFHVSNTKEAIYKLDKNNVIKVKYWFFAEGYCDSDIKHTYDEVRDTLVDVDIPKDLYNEGLKYLYFFMNIQNRWSDSTELYDYVHDFNLYFKYWYDVFIKENIEILIMATAPHEGVEYMAYVVAKVLKVKIIITAQICQLQNRFTCFKDVMRYGYNDFKFCNNYEYQHIENKFEKDLFYMKNVGPILISSDLNIVDFFDVKKIIKKIQKEKKYFLIFALEKVLYKGIRLILAKRFKDNKNKLCVSFNKDAKYVYFPLHLQPEMTTDTLGGIYVDQALALERISNMIPDDWIIYVKEHPAQTYYKRSKRFFDRMRSIKKVRYVDPATSTYELISNAQFISTINGTAGWEAISGGKNVLIFGYAWYRTLPGVFEYFKNIDINDILNYKINHKDLEDKFNQMSNSILLPGVIAGGDGKLYYKNFNVKDNNVIVYNSLKRAIENY